MRRVVPLPYPTERELIDPVSFGRWLRVARSRHGLTVEEVAAWTRLSRGTVLDLEGGASSVAIGNVLRVAQAVGVTLVARDADTVGEAPPRVPTGWQPQTASHADEAAARSIDWRDNQTFALALARSVGVATGVQVAEQAATVIPAVDHWPALFAGLASVAPIPTRRELLRRVLYTVMTADPTATSDQYVLGVAAGRWVVLDPRRSLIGRAPGAPAESALALPIGSARQFEALTAIEWARFADACGLAPRLVGRELERLAHAVVNASRATAQSLVDQGHNATVMLACARQVEAQAQRVAPLARMVGRVPKHLLQSAAR